MFRFFDFITETSNLKGKKRKIREKKRNKGKNGKKRKEK